MNFLRFLWCEMPFSGYIPRVTRRGIGTLEVEKYCLRVFR